MLDEAADEDALAVRARRRIAAGSRRPDRCERVANIGRCSMRRWSRIAREHPPDEPLELRQPRIAIGGGKRRNLAAEDSLEHLRGVPARERRRGR